MKNIMIILLLLCSRLAYAQLNDDFSDGNFTSDPLWMSSNSGADFIVTSNRLRSNSSIASSNFYLSTTNTLAVNCKWEFWVNLQFSTSGANYTDIYIISDQENLKNTLINGYFLRIGNTDDEISLYKRSGTTASSIKIIDGLNGSVGSTNNTVRIRISRSISGLFTLEREIVSSNSSFFTEGTATDLSFNSSSYFGILIQQSTSSFFQKHFFDDIRVGPIISDTIPPVLSSVFVIDTNTVELTFSEAMDSLSVKNTNNFTFNNNSAPPTQVLTTTDAGKYRLRMAASLNTGTYLLTVINAKDRNGNQIGINNTASFSYTKPYLSKLRDLVINEIFADASPQIDLPSVEFVELFNTTNNTISLKNWKFSDPSSFATFGTVSISPHSFLIICAKADTAEYLRFGKVYGLSPWPGLNNSGDFIRLMNPQNTVIDSIAYSDTWYRNSAKRMGGWTLERIDPLSKCEGLFNWMASKDTSGGTPGRENSVNISNYDLIALKADSLIKTSDTTVNLYFNKHMDAATFSADNFSLSPSSGRLKKIISNADYNQLSLVFSEKFLPAKTYNLSIFNVKDCSGNSINSTTKLSFNTATLPPPVPERTDTAKIFITEIFADPSPEIGLPLVEFIEIYNPGADTIDIQGWTISDPQTIGAFKKLFIPPKQYLILCPAADTIQYKSFGKTLGISPWPSLNNSSDQIVLKSFKNRIVDSVAYVDTWYRDPIKKQGGWSLERTDPFSKCEEYFNWAASKDTSGGSPGKLNSVNIASYDQLALKADSLIQTSDTTIKVFFNKHLNSATVITNNFSLSPASASIKKITSDIGMKQLSLTVGQKFTPGSTYTLSISNVKDCSGKAIVNNNQFDFKIPAILSPVAAKTDTARIFITEIFADPSPEVGLPLVEFIEIYNAGSDTIDLDGWTINDPTSMVSIRKQKILPYSYIILCPAADTMQYKNFGKTIGLSPWPSLANSSDQIVLKSFRNRLVDSVAYFDIWHSDAVKKKGGWSLECIDPFSKCLGSFNWTSSTDTAGGTPGRLNSVSISNYDLLALKADSMIRLSDTTIKIYFNKYLDSVTLRLDNFSLSPVSGLAINLKPDPQFKQITITFSQKFAAGKNYILTISNVKDCSGKIISNSGNTIKFKIPDLPPALPVRADTAKIFITEIFTDPFPELGMPPSEFIEIYNPGSDTINLQGWTISDPQSKATFNKSFILPRQYLILCPAADTTQYKNFGKTIGISPWPSLANNSDQIVLKSFANRVVDSVAYRESWYKDKIKKTGGWSLEKIDPDNNFCTDFFNWKASINPSGGTPGQINSINKPGYQLEAPKIDSVRITSDTVMVLFLNIIPDTTFIKPGNFHINNGIGDATTSILSDDYTKINLVFASRFQEGMDYVIRVDSLFNCLGLLSVKPGNQSMFSIPAIPEINYPVIINEIFADPSPIIELPESEFVELYNPGEKALALRGMTYGNQSNSYLFTSGEIASGDYLILCQAKDTSAFSPYGRVLGLPLWPALNNESGTLILKNNKGREIHRVSYGINSYRDPVKRKGGYSLELIDPASSCSIYQNWRASIDPSGGSPGRKNSVYSKNSSSEPLKLLKARLLDSVTLSLTFNRDIDSLSASVISNFSLNNGIGSPKTSLPKGPYFSEVLLKFMEPLSRGYTYRITTNNITDCAGTLIQPDYNSSEFILPKKILRNDILINEILFNPRADGVDFIEIYNNTDDVLNLQELSLARILKDTVSNIQVLSDSLLLLEPRQYLALSINPQNIRKEYYTTNPNSFLKMPAFPPFNDGSGTAVLISNGLRIDQFTYAEKMHFPLIKNFEGVSLERSSFKRGANETGNFRSATAASGFATPAYKNSQYTDEPNLNEEFSLASKTFSPDNDGYEDVLQINYRFANPGLIANITIFNDRGRLIKKLLRNFSLNAEGTVIWDGLNEISEIQASGIYLIHAEIFDTDGNIKRYRKACVLAVKF